LSKGLSDTPSPLPSPFHIYRLQAEAELVIPHVSCHKATHINQLEVGNMSGVVSVAEEWGGECQRKRGSFSCVGFD